MINKNQLLEDISNYVKLFFREHTDERLVFHNLPHTETVVKHCHEISRHYYLSPQDHFVLITAAWFHDTGHLVHEATNHEDSSIDIMETYCGKAGIDGNILHRVKKCIVATKLSDEPRSSLTEKIICDADLYHLGTPDFPGMDELVKREIELRTNTKISNWNEASLHFLKTHSFFTTYCDKLLTEGKLRNIKLLEEKINNLS